MRSPKKYLSSRTSSMSGTKENFDIKKHVHAAREEGDSKRDNKCYLEKGAIILGYGWFEKW